MYAIYKLTGSRLTDGTPEIGGLVSRHRSLAAAERKVSDHALTSPCAYRWTIRKIEGAK
jgi:hypothetical protein